jgi:hypothetical protein
MSSENWTLDYITLRGEEVPIKIGYLPQADLNFFSENPRIYSILSSPDEVPSQSEIQEILIKRDHVKQLIQSVKANGGLTDPIFVQEDSLVVLEGNSRLAAYRALASQDPLRWGLIKCKLLPKELDEEKIFSLLGEYHIVGKQDWAPYEQAGYLYRRTKFLGSDPQQMADDLGLSLKAVNHLINVYAFMVEHEDNNVSRWSYYDELLKSRKMNKCREQVPEFSKVVVKKIKSGEIPRAVDVRESLKKIVVAGKKTLNAFVSEKKSFEECVEMAITGGADEQWYQRLKKFRDWIADSKAKQEIAEMPENIKKKMLFEIKKIKTAIDRVEKQLEK